VEERTSQYLCPYCSTKFDTFEELKTHALAEHAGEPAPLPEGMIRLTINGDAYQIQVQPEWTLNYLIHDKLGLTSPKMFCDRGACGSCTVIMNGRPILSCMTLAIECDGNTIETAEGIADQGHPLVETYVKHHAMQCGYCTPGFITTSKALLDRNPNPTEEEIREALGGNLCRCGTYPQHPKAILEAAEILRDKEGGEIG
jgi:aerobic-type carbon monoxide dehydrogenase small subunit (CoxS/CutS family)